MVRVRVCVCVWWFICDVLYACVVHGNCMLHVCVCLSVCVACVFTGPKPLQTQAYNTSPHRPTADNLQSLGPGPLENGQGCLLPSPL